VIPLVYIYIYIYIYILVNGERGEYEAVHKLDAFMAAWCGVPASTGE
jgi:hypothetical protein